MGVLSLSGHGQRFDCGVRGVRDGLAGPPVGAVIFGRMGDRRGRRTVLVIVILLMAGATGAVAFLPGYASIGLLAPLALMALRATQGLAAGGELA